ncbi:pentatricopeptide repeat-containing protein [Tanacetum coccineum]
MGQQVHCLVCKYGLCFDLFVANGLIEMYCKCESLSHARTVFDEMLERDVVSLTNMIAGYSNVGRVEESRALFEKMGLEGLGGNEFTWNALITWYARVGDCDEAFSLFRKMSEEGLVPDVATWNAMISGFMQSQEMVKGVEPDLAKKMTEDVMKIKTNRPGGFVTLSNVCTGEGEWEKVEMLREVMKVQGVQKQPGLSSLSNEI